MMVDHGRIEMEHDLASPPACCFVCWSLLRTCRSCNCLLIVDTLLCCNALPLYPLASQQASARRRMENGNGMALMRKHVGICRERPKFDWR